MLGGAGAHSAVLDLNLRAIWVLCGSMHGAWTGCLENCESTYGLLCVLPQAPPFAHHQQNAPSFLVIM